MRGIVQIKRKADKKGLYMVIYLMILMIGSLFFFILGEVLDSEILKRFILVMNITIWNVCLFIFPFIAKSYINKYRNKL